MVELKKVLAIIVIVLSALSCNRKSNKTENNSDKPNILWIVADDLGTDWSQRKPGQPFFSQIQIYYPHRAFTRDSLFPVDQNAVQLPPYYPDHRIERQDWALYLETIQILDREVGKILARLEKDSLADSTIVFFFGDQGRCMMRAKQFMYDGGIHTPLIIRYPGEMYKRTVKDVLVSNLDLAPASFALAGIQIPDYMQGIDFLDSDVQEREYIFSMRKFIHLPGIKTIRILCSIFVPCPA